ncbi:MAG: alpha/beta hydrolase [Anaerolineae bacterium]|nr:MAG: alpha/beta hydrolase [Anaerolineae bacterium]
MSAIIIEDRVVHYEVLGRGKPVIFLHGWVGSWRYWIPTMQATSVTYRAYAVDLWGFGDSAKSADRYSLESQTNLLDRFLNEMGIAKVALVGHGLGAIVAALFASKHPFVVDRYMAIGMPFTPADLNERMASGNIADLAGWLLAQNPSTEAARTEAPKADGEAIRTSLTELQHIDMMAISRQMGTAALIVHGQNDPAVKTPNLSNGSLPGSSHHLIFEEVGHFPMLDQPSKFHRLLSDFLELGSGESPQQLQLKDEWKRRVR